MPSNSSFLHALNQSYDLIRTIERLSAESSMEELCKMVLREYFSTEAFEGWEMVNLSTMVQTKISESLQTAYNDFLIEGGAAFTTFLQDKHCSYLKENVTPYPLAQYMYDVLKPGPNSLVADFCCGTGGTLVEAINVEPSVRIFANDINRRMANTTHLNLMIHGCREFKVTCENSVHQVNQQYKECFDYVVTDPPKGGFHIAGTSSTTYGPGSLIEAHFLLDIIETLKPGGIAAVVLSDYILSSSKNVGFWRSIDQQADVRNITRYEITEQGASSSSGTFYNIMFIRKKQNLTNVSSMTSAAVIRQGYDDTRIRKTSEWLHFWMANSSTVDIPFNCKVLFSDKLQNWSVTPLFLMDEVRTHYPITQLGDIIMSCRERIVIKKDKEYTVFRVKAHGMGMDVRAKVKGSNLHAQAWQKVRTGHLVVSSRSADNGGVAVVTPKFNGAIASIRDYYVFDVISSEINADYLAMVLCSEPVKRQLTSMFNKEVIMPRISLTNFLSIYIPIPPIEIQQQLARTMVLSIRRVKMAEDRLNLSKQSFQDGLFLKSDLSDNTGDS